LHETQSLFLAKIKEKRGFILAKAHKDYYLVKMSMEKLSGVNNSTNG